MIEKIYYPNSELASKAISNFNRSPDMSDSVDFDLDVSTSNEIISVLKAKIKGCVLFILYNIIMHSEEKKKKPFAILTKDKCDLFSVRNMK